MNMSEFTQDGLQSLVTQVSNDNIDDVHVSTLKSYLTLPDTIETQSIKDYIKSRFISIYIMKLSHINIMDVKKIHYYKDILSILIQYITYIVKQNDYSLCFLLLKVLLKETNELYLSDYAIDKRHSFFSSFSIPNCPAYYLNELVFIQHIYKNHVVATKKDGSVISITDMESIKDAKDTAEYAKAKRDYFSSLRLYDAVDLYDGIEKYKGTLVGSYMDANRAYHFNIMMSNGQDKNYQRCIDGYIYMNASEGQIRPLNSISGGKTRESVRIPTGTWQIHNEIDIDAENKDFIVSKDRLYFSQLLSHCLNEIHHHNLLISIMNYEIENMESIQLSNQFFPIDVFSRFLYVMNSDLLKNYQTLFERYIETYIDSRIFKEEQMDVFILDTMHVFESFNHIIGNENSKQYADEFLLKNILLKNLNSQKLQTKLLSINLLSTILKLIDNHTQYPDGVIVQPDEKQPNIMVNKSIPLTYDFSPPI